MFIQLTQTDNHDRDNRSPITIAVDQIAVLGLNRQGDTRIRLKSGENVYVEESYQHVCDAINEALLAQQDNA